MRHAPPTHGYSLKWGGCSGGKPPGTSDAQTEFQMPCHVPPVPSRDSDSHVLLKVRRLLGREAAQESGGGEHGEKQR